MGLLTHALNAKKHLADRAGRMIPTIRPAETGAKRRKNRLSVRGDIRFSAVGLHLSIFEGARGRCEWCQAITDRKLESRPFSKCKQCKVFLCLEKKRNCFFEIHDERYFKVEEAPLEDVEAVYSSAEKFLLLRSLTAKCLSINRPTRSILLHPQIPTNWKILILPKKFYVG